MYFFIAPLYFLRKKSKAIMLTAILIMLLILFTGRIFFIEELMSMHTVLMMDFWINFAILFMIGALLSLIEIEKIPYKITVLITALILFVVCLPLAYFEFIQYLLLPVIVILTGSGYLKGISTLTEKTGDISYGTYIYGFIVQQLIMHFFALSSNELLFISLPLTLFFGWLSWHFIEKHALAKKQIVYQKIKKYF
jgi:peptidoglycan/LPS O-acetylase OafA/YrhL